MHERSSERLRNYPFHFLQCDSQDGWTRSYKHYNPFDENSNGGSQIQAIGKAFDIWLAGRGLES
jgi:hypothetical protein